MRDWFVRIGGNSAVKCHCPERLNIGVHDQWICCRLSYSRIWRWLRSLDSLHQSYRPAQLTDANSLWHQRSVAPWQYTRALLDSTLPALVYAVASNEYQTPGRKLPQKAPISDDPTITGTLNTRLCGAGSTPPRTTEHTKLADHAVSPTPSSGEKSK
jgi:hypothetical protein